MSAALLTELQRLLEKHADAARDGDVDALAACAAQVRQQLSVLARSAPAAIDVAALETLLLQCIRTQSFLARRQQDVERSLAALRAGAPGAAQAQPVYGVDGMVAPGIGPGRGFGRA